MTCRTGECGTIHSFGQPKKVDGSYTCDCGMFTMQSSKGNLGRARHKRILWHPSADFFDAIVSEPSFTKEHRILEAV